MPETIAACDYQQVATISSSPRIASLDSFVIYKATLFFCESFGFFSVKSPLLLPHPALLTL